MKFIVFRPTFVTVGMMFQLVALLCALLSTVSASPQFGRPMFHALDEANPGDEHVQSTAMPSVPAVDAASTASPSSGLPLVLNQSSGASHHLGGVHTALVLSAAASAVYFVL